MAVNLELLDGPAHTPWFFGNQRPLYDGFLSDPSRPKALWLYTACGSHGCSRNDNPYTTGWAGYEIDAPGSQQRAIGWLAFNYNASGTLYYDMTLQLGHAWENQYYSNGKGAQARQIAKSLFPAAFPTARSDGDVQAAHRQLAALVKQVVGK